MRSLRTNDPHRATVTYDAVHHDEQETTVVRFTCSTLHGGGSDRLMSALEFPMNNASEPRLCEG